MNRQEYKELEGHHIGEDEHVASIVQVVKIESLVVGTEQPEKFIDALENLCRTYASVQDAENGDGFTFKFSVES